MSEKDKTQPGGISLGDIYYVLFRHKWLIILSAVAGISAAVFLLFVYKPPTYRSQTQLQIKYVTESKSPLQPGAEENTQSLENFYTLMTSEVIILHSLDLARDVVSSIGAAKILAKAGGGTNFDQAAMMVKKGLEIEQLNGGNVLVVAFEHPDRAIVQDVLKQVIVSYYKRHNEMHQPPEISDFQAKETERLSDKLNELDEELSQAKRKAGVIVPDEAQKGYSIRISQIRDKIDNAETDLAERQAILEQMIQASQQEANATNTGPKISLREQINEYKSVCARLDILSKREQELLTQFTPESTLVQEVRKHIAQTEKEKEELEKRFPNLAYPLTSTPALAGAQAGTNAVNPTMEMEQISALKSKIVILKEQFDRVWAEATNLDTMMTIITDLQKKKELAENDLKFYTASVTRNKMEAAMGDQAAPNISILESPTPPAKSWSKSFKKKVAMVALGGVFGGLALAFLIELMLDTSVKRPGDILTKLRLPLLISIPDTSRNGRRKNPARLNNTEAGTTAVVGQTSPENAGWNQASSLNRFYTGLRDRLLVYFEVRNVNHKPKLVAVTSCHQGAGVSSIAAGLAASLSETGDGNVLLVDMNPEQQVVQQFHKGKLAAGLTSALSPETKNNNLVQEKLYVVTERIENEKQFRHLPKRFSELVPKLKASDYDYIIFDMPPVSSTSVTPRLAGLMDMVLLVIESEKTNQDVVKKANALLTESKANVNTVLNKTYSYIPKRLHQEYLHDT